MADASAWNELVVLHFTDLKWLKSPSYWEQQFNINMQTKHCIKNENFKKSLLWCLKKVILLRTDEQVTEVPVQHSHHTIADDHWTRLDLIHMSQQYLFNYHCTVHLPNHENVHLSRCINLERATSSSLSALWRLGTLQVQLETIYQSSLHNSEVKMSFSPKKRWRSCHYSCWPACVEWRWGNIVFTSVVLLAALANRILILMQRV